MCVVVMCVVHFRTLWGTSYQYKGKLSVQRMGNYLLELCNNKGKFFWSA